MLGVSMVSSNLFPIAFVINTFSMTGVLILLGLSGRSEMATEVGIVQAATVALFYAFSANARSLILNQHNPVAAADILHFRVLLLLPLSIAAYFLSSVAMEVDLTLVLALILRRAVEWLQEVTLSKEELLSNKKAALNYVTYQSLLLGILTLWIIFGLSRLEVVLLVWAIFPLLFDFRYIFQSLNRKVPVFSDVCHRLIPHLGSSVIVGISVYVFRLILLLVTDKHIAGDLFTAFAIGGVLGSVFANALGPSVVFNNLKSGQDKLPAKISFLLYGFAFLGAAIYLATFLGSYPEFIAFKEPFFYQSVGLSMVGGVIMVYAQKIKFRLLQTQSDAGIFGADVLINIAIFSLIPAIAFILGKDYLSFLYLLTSAASYLIYKNTKVIDNRNMSNKQVNREIKLYLIAALLFLPIFFQFNGGLFHQPGVMYSSQGLLNLPIPVSLFTCFVGIFILGAYKQSYLSSAVIFFTTIIMVLSSIFLFSENGELNKNKLILMIQYLLPMFGLVLGQMFAVYNSKNKLLVTKAFLWILILVVPVQIFFTLISRYVVLSPQVGLFSIYQHLQYVPVIFISAYLYVMFHGWYSSIPRSLLVVLTIFMSFYVAASISMLAMGFFYIGLLFLALYDIVKNKSYVAVILLVFSILSSVGFIHANKEKLAFKFGFLSSFSQTHNSNDFSYDLENMAPNISDRISYWEYYISNISADMTSAMLGHSEPPERSKYPSAHNYYLDFVYNFGFLSLVPLVFLIGYTSYNALILRKRILELPGLLGLSMVVLFLIFADNSFKVGFRQPYPGIFSFFLWGMLLVRLNELRLKNATIK